MIKEIIYNIIEVFFVLFIANLILFACVGATTSIEAFFFLNLIEAIFVGSVATIATWIFR